MCDGQPRGEAVEWHAFVTRRVVAGEFGVSEKEMMTERRGAKDVAFARQVAMYMAHVVFQLTYDQVGDAFRRERTTVAHACGRIEDSRDDPVLDEKLNRLEDRLKGLERLRRGRIIRRSGRLKVILQNVSDQGREIYISPRV